MAICLFVVNKKIIFIKKYKIRYINLRISISDMGHLRLTK